MYELHVGDFVHIYKRLKFILRTKQLTEHVLPVNVQTFRKETFFARALISFLAPKHDLQFLMDIGHGCHIPKFNTIVY